MFIVLLKFSDNKGEAASLMDDHNNWIQRGFDDGVFLLTGILQPRMGGVLLAHNTTLSELQNRVQEDPFVSKKVVDCEILEITPTDTDSRLSFLEEKQ